MLMNGTNLLINPDRTGPRFSTANRFLFRKSILKEARIAAILLLWRYNVYYFMHHGGHKERNTGYTESFCLLDRWSKEKAPEHANNRSTNLRLAPKNLRRCQETMPTLICHILRIALSLSDIQFLYTGTKSVSLQGVLLHSLLYSSCALRKMKLKAENHKHRWVALAFFKLGAV